MAVQQTTIVTTQHHVSSGTWTTGICDCCSDMSTCCCGLFCFPCMQCQTVSQFGWCFCMPLLDCCMIVSCCFRQKTRERYNINVSSCHRCQLNDPLKTAVPVLHSIKVKEAWEVLGLDLIGPLPETARTNKYVLTMTDLYTKWVIAEPMQSKTAAEVSAIITTKLYSFGIVRKIITDQGKEFVNKLNDSIFSALKIKHAVSSAYHPQTNGQDERTNQNIKRTLRKYVNDNHNDWDLHLPAVVYGINTANQVLSNIEKAQSRQQKSFQNSKSKYVRECSIEAGDDVLLSGDPKKMRTGDTLTSQHQGPYSVANISSKGVATIVKGSVCKRVSVSRLRTYYRLKNGPNEMRFLQDHGYSTFKWQIDHPYACSGAKWEKILSPIQDELLKYVLDENRPPGELIVKQGKICLTREDFWSLGLSQFMESNIGNACLKIMEEAARRHGKSVHIMDLYVVPTWKNKNVYPVHVLPTHYKLH
ncbi:plac8 onzin related protein 1 isoform X3 [Triplophysa rosa]|uniref:plac8 onzin related protein 1 isoform X3 n=1 Tax=Triplophysa rosa TaxID=992332 RepID=UPI002545F7D1|nr:plac8 onzin related protein 1 isoform X3 [Triplophysa rosa]